MMNQNKSKTIAYVTDIHLGQQLQMDNELGDGKMSYIDNPDEHKQNFILILDDIKKRGITEIVFGGDIGTKNANPWFLIRSKNTSLNCSWSWAITIHFLRPASIIIMD
jgi:Icc protein